jgi:hypothetical protein
MRDIFINKSNKSALNSRNSTFYLTKNKNLEYFLETLSILELLMFPAFFSSSICVA